MKPEWKKNAIVEGATAPALALDQGLPVVTE
jgi:hypothetical protein